VLRAPLAIRAAQTFHLGRPHRRPDGSCFKHLRTHRGDHEVDLIVQAPDGRVVAIEVKLSAAPPTDAVTHLKWLADRIGDELLDSVIIATGTEAYRRHDGIAVVPAALVGV
jgi:predicted AAA+ superfamily ATPase